MPSRGRGGLKGRGGRLRYQSVMRRIATGDRPALGRGGLSMNRSAEPATADRGMLPSRNQALTLCRAALSTTEDHGPVLLTGEAGSGKTWLWRRLVDHSRAASRRWVALDLFPTFDPDEFLRTLALAMGLGRLGARRTRNAIREALAEADDDDRKVALIVDEAHNANPAVLEELRILSNRLGQPGGFAALLVVGQTRLARQLDVQVLGGLNGRLTARIHLRPIDADEAHALLCSSYPATAWSADQADALHRDAAGNPRRLLRAGARFAVRYEDLASPSPVPVAPSPTHEALSRQATPLLGPPRPPLRVEDGLIEVGWAGDEAESTPETLTVEASPPRPASSRLDHPSDELVQDPYAALQAWAEWSENQGRGQVRTDKPVGADESVSGPDSEEDSDPPTRLWADEPQGFAPYSQLFSRLKQYEKGAS